MSKTSTVEQPVKWDWIDQEHAVIRLNAVVRALDAIVDLSDLDGGEMPEWGQAAIVGLVKEVSDVSKAVSDGFYTTCEQVRAAQRGTQDGVK